MKYKEVIYGYQIKDKWNQWTQKCNIQEHINDPTDATDSLLMLILKYTQ